MLSNMLDAMKVSSMMFVITFFLFTIYGLQEGLRGSAVCGMSPARVEYAMPGFQFGCWLGVRTKDKGDEKSYG